MSLEQVTDIEPSVMELLSKHSSIAAVRLAGSRSRGEALPMSDWDFEIEPADTAAAIEAIPHLAEQLDPVVGQWDRLSPTHCYMLLLSDGTKVDLIFDVPHTAEPPWEASAGTLPGIDAHFWDWIVWLAAKEARGSTDLVAAELDKMHGHLLAPLGVAQVPETIEEAAALYRAARESAQERFGITVPPAVEAAVVSKLRSGGYAV